MWLLSLVEWRIRMILLCRRMDERWGDDNTYFAIISLLKSFISANFQIYVAQLFPNKVLKYVTSDLASLSINMTQRGISSKPLVTLGNLFFIIPKHRKWIKLRQTIFIKLLFHPIYRQSRRHQKRHQPDQFEWIEQYANTDCCWPVSQLHGGHSGYHSNDLTPKEAR